MPRLHSGAATDRPEVTHLKLPPIPEVVWQQPQETHLTSIHNGLTNETHKDTHKPKQKNDVEAQTSPIKETSPQVSGSDTESLLENPTRSIPVECPNDPKKQQNEIQRNEIGLLTYGNGDDNISPPEITTSQIQEQLVRDDITNELYMPLSSTIVLKRKKEMLYVPLDFENGLTIDALVDSGAYVSAIAQRELDRIKQESPSNILKIDDPPNFQIQVANGQLEKPTATATLKFDIGDHIFVEHFVVMKNLTGPIIGLHFLKYNSVVIDTTHGLIHFPHLTMQVKSASSQASAKPQPVLIHESITIPQMTTKTITAFVDHSSEWNTTGTVTPVEKFTEAAILIISHSLSRKIDRKIAIRVTNTTESPYTINKNTQIAQFSLLNPEQSMFNKPVDTAILSMIPEGYPALITYLTELLRTNKTDQQNETFWFPTLKNPGNTEDHTPIQTRILTELRELQRREKLNPKDNSESRIEFLKRFDWTDTLLKETEKQAFEDILVEYHDIFAKHRMDIGMNTEFNVKLTPKDDKAVYSQSLPMPIHLKEDLIVELALMHKDGIITVLPFSKYASPIIAQRKPNGKLRLLVDLRKINTLIVDDYTNNNHPVSTLSDAAQHLAGKSLFCKLDCSQAYHCLQMADQRSVEMLAYVLLATDRRFKHYKANEDRIILKDGLLFRKHYGEIGSVKYYQILIPKQLVDEVLRNLHGEFSKPPGITETTIGYREKYYYPDMAQLIREWIMSCEQCIRESRINPRLIRPLMQNPNQYITAPEDAMQIDLVPG